MSSSQGLRDAVSHVKLSKIIYSIFFVLIVATVVSYSFLPKVELGTPNADSHFTRNKLEALEDFSVLAANDLRTRIEEMTRIKGSVSSELRELEAKRQRLQQELTSQGSKIEALKSELSRHQTELERLKMSVEQAQVAQREAARRNAPDLAPPRRILPERVPDLVRPASPENSRNCRTFSCFDHSRCSLTSGFPVYLYDPEVVSVVRDGFDADGFLKTTVKRTAGYNPHFTADPAEACVFLALVGEATPADGAAGPSVDGEALRRLPHWGGDGRNHVLLNLARRDLGGAAGDAFGTVDTGRAMLAQSAFTHGRFRDGFDLVVPPALGPPGGDVWQECPPMVPARRRYLLSFQGETGRPGPRPVGVAEGRAVDEFAVRYLRKMAAGESDSGAFLLQFECAPVSERAPAGDWSLCGTDSTRRAVLARSTFALILAPRDAEYASTTLLQARLYEALRAGAVPVVLGGDRVRLPYAETVDWRRCSVSLPLARVTELHFLLRAVPDPDLLAMRRQGRLVWERYLATVQATVDTVLAAVRSRLLVPPRAVESARAASAFNSSFEPLRAEPAPPEAEPEESLGPMEAPHPSPAFRRNHSLMLTQGHEIWNSWGDPFRLYPDLPFDPVLPSEAKFSGSEHGFRPIGGGAGGAGKEFCEALGGDRPREQFTVVMLTYEREQVLLGSVARLRGLPYLNKVVVVWNGPRPPAEDLRWPEIGVPVVVVKAARNSLNNRFLPYDAIETEAVLSVDDDAHLRHDEITFGFRVWREHRDRVVGFPGRYHARDLNGNDGWLYNSNYSCELSMVLTGAAFVHRHYNYLYWNLLPKAVRDKVDEYTNCEDIAMNFLVSHVTRKPPVKVTSRWTFRCPGCPVSLSEDETHFNERHRCINFFAKVFGYTPLLNTQYRADSILFKTRIPHDKQKCFKFI